MITFSRVIQTSDPITGTVSPTTRQFVGSGFMKSEKPDAYEALGLVAKSSTTIVFSCREYGYRAHSSDFVMAGDTTVILGMRWTVASVRIKVALDGIVVLAYIVVSK